MGMLLLTTNAIFSLIKLILFENKFILILINIRINNRKAHYFIWKHSQLLGVSNLVGTVKLRIGVPNL